MGMPNANKIKPVYLIRELRLPFITASILPFIFGSLLAKNNFHSLAFFLGLICVGCTHLSANLINDYADSKSGADWQDRHFYGFFGGSKLIQDKILDESFYLSAAVVCFAIASLCILILALILHSFFIIVIFSLIILLAWFYSLRPLAFSYHHLGEVIIFLLFGPALVMGGYFIQTKIFPTLIGFLLSLPFGFLTTAILFTNEVPDCPDDKKAGKFTWVSLIGAGRAFIIYAFLICAAFIFILANVAFGNLKPLAVFSLIFILPAIKAVKILKQYPADKNKLIESSKITIAIQALVSIILILGLIL
jgi:1,4-dihydroxy-2-naphthoate octaprenyltransferase